MIWKSKKESVIQCKISIPNLIDGYVYLRRINMLLLKYGEGMVDMIHIMLNSYFFEGEVQEET